MLVAAAIVVVAWFGTGVTQTSQSNRFAKFCETVSDHLNGDAEPAALTNLLEARR
jgi:hypothetical protein